MDIGSIFEEARSLYIYHPECNKTPASNLSYGDDTRSIKTLSKLDVIACYDKGMFTNSDLQIANVVAKNIFASQGMVEKYIEHMTATKSEKESVPIIQSMNYLKDRLKTLTKANILIKYSYNALPHEGKEFYKHSYYLVSPHGYNFLKKIVGFSENYDEYLAVTPIDEVFKYLSAVMVSQGFFAQAGFKDYKMNVPFYRKEKKQLHYIYSLIDVQKDEVDYKVVLEPIKFRFDRNRISEKDWVESIHKRFILLKEYINHMISKGTSSFGIIIACEDIKGIKNAGLFVNKYLSDYLPYIYLTTDGVVSLKGIKNAFISISSDGELRHIVPPFISD